MCQRGISYDNCCGRYNVGHSTITRIMSRYEELGRGLETLKQLAPAEVEKAFYPPENIRRKDESIMPDFAAIYERMMRAGSKANLYFIWLRYKKEHPSGYQYTQFCYYNEYVALHYGAKNLSIVPRASPSLLVFQSELSRPTINRLQILLYEVIGHDESKYD